MKKNENWYKQKMKDLKEDKKRDLNKHKTPDEVGSSSDVRNRKKITEEYKKEKRRIKRSQKQETDQELKELKTKYNSRTWL